MFDLFSIMIYVFIHVASLRIEIISMAIVPKSIFAKMEEADFRFWDD